MADFDLTQSGQEIQNILDGAAMQTDLTAEIERAEQAEQQLQDNIDIEETRAKAAEKQNADDIDVIEGKIPAAASSENQLADKAFVNSSIATATATYRGAFNLVSDLHLTIDATEQQIAAALAGAISTADNNDYCFVQVPTADATPTQIAAIERYKFNGTAWAYEYTLNNSGFTADQWAALNSGITTGLVAKLAVLPTNDELTLLLGGKQDVLTFDNVPTEGSNNPVKSGGVKSAIDSEKERAQGAEQANAGNIAQVISMIPAAASSENQLADKNFVNSSIATNTATYRGAYNEVSDLSLTVDATHEQIAAALAGAISTADNNDYCFVQIPTADTTPTQIAAIERYKFNGTAWAYEYTLNNSGFTADQWAAINSGITSGLVTKLAALPTNDDLIAALAGKQPMLTFDNVPTESSTNPVKSGGVYAAIAEEAGTRAAAIAAIVALIPSAASALNQLADKAFVNSSISTATAVFKGTFNVVADLELNYNASQAQIALMLGSKIASADNNDYCFVQIPTSNETPLEIARTDRYKFNGTAWAYEYTLNNSGFTAAQWAAINSGITSLLKDKLIDLPTATELATQLAAKQNTLTFDPTPTEGSTNPVTSDGIHAAINVEKERAEAAEEALNTNKADKATTLAGYGITDAYNKTEVNNMITTPNQNYVTVATYASLPASGSTDTIYRVSSYDGANNQADDTVYSEYAWNGTQYVFLDVKSQIDEVFDITVYNSNTKYADLAAALGTNGANIPQSLRRGGMSVKYVQSSDNKYIQARLMANSFTTDITQWQVVDEEPFEESNNLVEAGGVNRILTNVAKNISSNEAIVSREDATIINGYFLMCTIYFTKFAAASDYNIIIYDVTNSDLIYLLKKIDLNNVTSFALLSGIPSSEEYDNISDYLIWASSYSNVDVNEVITKIITSNIKYIAVSERTNVQVPLYCKKPFDVKNELGNSETDAISQKAVTDAINECQSKYVYIDGDPLAIDTRKPVYINHSYDFVGDGGATYKTILYAVEEGELFHIVGNLSDSNVGAYAFYNTDNLVAGVNTSIVVNPKIKANVPLDNIVKVPNGATYLGVAEKYNDTYSVKHVEKELLEDLLKSDNTNIIYCWGDSLTWGAGGTDWPTIINGMQSSCEMVNCGVGGEGLPTIAARQGGNLITIKNEITLPADTTPINIGNAPFNLGFGYGNLLGQGQGRYINTINPMDLGGIKVNLSISDGNYYLTRISAGIQRTFAAGTEIIPIGSSFKKCDGNIYWVGTNGGSFDSLAELKERIDKMINYNGNGNYIVIGLHQTASNNTPNDVVAINAYLKTNYGNQFIDQLEYMVKYGIQDAIQLGLLPNDGTYPTAQDEEDMQNNYPPTSLRHDETHYNTIGYTLIAHLVLDRMKALGMNN